MSQTTPPIDQKNLILAAVLCAILMIGWQIFIEAPKRAQLAQWNALQEQKKLQATAQKPALLANSDAPPARPLTREEAMAQSARLKISTPSLHGTIALKGLRFDDLTLAKYRETINADSPEVALLAPSAAPQPYFMQTGWVALDGKTPTPNDSSVWLADSETLTPEKPVTLTWDNGAGVLFRVILSVDADYMFSLKQEVQNRTGATLSIAPYALINRAYTESEGHMGIMHEGPLGVSEKSLHEVPYSDLRDEKEHIVEAASSWVGITDKYWLTALVPQDESFKATYSYYQVRQQDRYQVDYMGGKIEVPAGGSQTHTMRFFAGAKEIDPLDRYTLGDAAQHIPPVPLFDRAVDFGMLYFLTKPIFLALNSFYHVIGNFGLAILLLTVVIKLFMFPLANKAYKATTQMRALQPEMARVKEQYGNDKLKMQQEMMLLYKREKVNPAAGCLPILVQIPVFFALYKVLYVTIEMRHAPFFGWIRDLSGPDTSNLFNVFGLIAWNPPMWLHLGILPIVMCASMVLQMRQQPAPPDPMQAKMLKYMPYFFLLFFKGMPSGLLVYWTWSNALSIAQQHYITKKFKKVK